MNCLIIDYNEHSRDTLNQMIARIDDLYVSEEFDNALDAFNYLQGNKVDILFLEVEMPGISGIELVRNLRAKNLIIIFTTSKRDYASDAYDLDATDYLIKPVSGGRFMQAVNKAREILMQRKKETGSVEIDYLFIRDSAIVRKIKMEDILYAQAMGDYVRFHTYDKLYVIHGKLKNAEARFSPAKFVRIHRSYIICLSRIETVEDGGITINGQFLPVAEAYKKDLYSRINFRDAPFLRKYG
jgi:DNA-binding LytR/AlgR family response regulator